MLTIQITNSNAGLCPSRSGSLKLDLSLIEFSQKVRAVEDWCGPHVSADWVLFSISHFPLSYQLLITQYEFASILPIGSTSGPSYGSEMISFKIAILFKLKSFTMEQIKIKLKKNV